MSKPPSPLTRQAVKILDELKAQGKPAIIRSAQAYMDRTRHVWFPYHPTYKLNGKTFDALLNRGLIELSSDYQDWRWTTYVRTDKAIDE